MKWISEFFAQQLPSPSFNTEQGGNTHQLLVCPFWGWGLCLEYLVRCADCSPHMAEHQVLTWFVPFPLRWVFALCHYYLPVCWSFFSLRVLLTIYSALKESIFPRGHFHRPGEAAECSWSRRGLRSDWSEVAQPSHAPLEAAPSSSFTLSSLWGCFSCYKPTFMGFCSFDDSTLTLWIHWHRMLSLLISQCL